MMWYWIDCGVTPITELVPGCIIMTLAPGFKRGSIQSKRCEHFYQCWSIRFCNGGVGVCVIIIQHARTNVVIGVCVIITQHARTDLVTGITPHQNTLTYAPSFKPLPLSRWFNHIVQVLHAGTFQYLMSVNTGCPYKSEPVQAQSCTTYFYWKLTFLQRQTVVIASLGWVS